jgi:hypothetical protein
MVNRMELDYHKIINKLNDISLSPSSLVEDNGNAIKEQQIWTLKNTNPDIATYLCYISEIIGEDRININSIFRWTELAGPEDLKLPHEFIGSRAVFSFELAATINIDKLDRCIGRLDNKAIKYINNAKKDLDLAHNRPPFSWGRAYLDEYDVRYKYHELIIADIEKMQSEIITNIFEDEDPSGWKIINTPFQQQEEEMFAIAASSSKHARKVEYKVMGMDNVIVTVSEVDNSDLCNIYVYDKKGHISLALAETQILNTEQEKIATIDKNNSEFAKAAIIKGFCLLDKNGKKIKLQPKN